MSEFLFDKNGNAVAHLKADMIYAINGYALAFIDNGNAYDYSGKQIGSFRRGWLRDLDGCVVAFMKGASGAGPMKPICKIPPIPSVCHYPPIRPIHQIPKIPAMEKMRWSDIPAERFLKK